MFDPPDKRSMVGFSRRLIDADEGLVEHLHSPLSCGSVPGTRYSGISSAGLAASCSSWGGLATRILP
ncbi:MAG: hypothetical protein U5K56_07645 [Halioglobus sp.]|nr:hypothetical protein [Halioglobus sp.]